jgi:hypothetical protein
VIYHCYISGILHVMAEARAVVADLTTLDRTALEALIVAQQSELSAEQEKLRSRDSEIEHLKLVIAKLRRMMFGTKRCQPIKAREKGAEHANYKM